MPKLPEPCDQLLDAQASPRSHPRYVFKAAILLNAASIVIAHNHPSGDPAPSREDREVTRAIGEAGRLLDIPLHDHVIVGEESYFSFRDAGLI